MSNDPESDELMEITYMAARRLRARVYGECSDRNWEVVRDNWSTPENMEWLDAQPQNAPFRVSALRGFEV